MSRPQQVNCNRSVGQIYNVLIILAITLLMTMATIVLAYFVDFLPKIFGNIPPISSDSSVGRIGAVLDN